ncbi:hypothetical protein AK812_SmicGene45546 [Symbiodinium microadriaticum]|uniref:Uncharacterized protein n=1 Tax=Symbiodinium microadriaticum TaxID=2951 RepID=A0A1Q9BW49_SYMMI|nr:hypothetical protein AK812_SmicGene45546 [Symbiodinium microadriaticum]
MFRTLQATARLQAELGKAAPVTPPKAAPKVLTDRLQAERGKAAPATPYKAAPKALGLPGSSAVEASALETDEDVMEGLDFASQFSPPFGTERQYLDLEVAAPAAEVLEHPAPAHVEEEPGQPASPTSGEEAEGSDSRGLKAAKSAARRLLEDLVREQERQETMEAPTVPGFRRAIQCGKECGKDEAVGPSNDTAGTASRTCTSLTSTTSRSCSGAPRSFSAIPAYVDYAISGSSGTPGSNGISAFCGTPDADGAKAGCHDGQMDSSGNTGSHRGTEAGSHRSAEGGFHRGASSGSYDGTATFSDHGAAIFSKGGTAATVPRPSTSMTPAAPHEAPNEMQLMAMGIVANDGPTCATGGPTYANGEPIYAGNHGDDGSEDVTFNEGDPLSEARRCHQQGTSGARASRGCAGSGDSGEFILQLAASSTEAKVSDQPEASSAGCVGVGETQTFTHGTR